MKSVLLKKLSFVITVIIIMGGLQIENTVYAKDASKLTNQEASNTSTGKNYDEQNVLLPTLHSDEKVLGMTFNPEGNCEIYIGTWDEKKNHYHKFYRYTRNVKENWTASEIKWSTVFSDNTGAYPSNFQYSENGKLYCIANDIIDTKNQWFMEIGKDDSIKKINVPLITDIAKDHTANITSYVMTGNNILIFVLNHSLIYAVDMKTGKMIYTLTGHTPMKLNSNSTNFYIADYNTNKILGFNINTGNMVDSYSLPYGEQNKGGLIHQKEQNSCLLTNHDSLYFVSTSGIYQYCNGKENCLVKGYANLLSQPSKNLNTYATLGKDKAFYVLGYNLQKTYQLTRYSVNSSDSTQYQGEFTVAMYQKNDRVMEAVALYAWKHPKIKVTCKYLYKTSDLEVQKKAWEASDVIVCDSKVYSELRKYDLLKNLSNTAKTLISSEGLYDNIINSFYEGSNLLVMPAEFSAYIFTGKKELLDNSGSILSIANYAKKNKKKVWQGMSYESLGYVFYRTFNKQLIKDSREWNETNLRNLLKSLKSTSDIDLNKTYINDPESIREDLFQNFFKHKDSLVYTSISQKIELMELIASLSLYECGYRGNGTFETNSLVGINKKTNDTYSDEFLEFLYGADAQNTKIGVSIPLRKSSLMDWTNSNSGSNAIVNNTSWYSGCDLTENDITCFQNTLSTMTTYARYDETQSNALQQALEFYMSGDRSFDDTIDRIISNKVYQKSYSSLSLDTSKELNILFIGNSLTNSWKITEQFDKMAKINGKNIKVNKMLYDGYSLSQHLLIMTDDRKEMLQKADVIICQEFGGKSDTTAEDVMKIKNMASKDAIFLFYLTHFDTNNNNNNEQRIGQIDDINFIPAGHVHDLLIEKGIYNYSDLHMVNDYHQNALYAFIIAQTMYATLFDTDLSSITYSKFSSYIDTSLKSTTISDKNAEVEKMQDVIKEIFNM